MPSRVRRVLLAALLLTLAAPARGEDLKGDAAAGMATANNAFAWDLYGAVRGGEDNLFLSPYSVHVALLMTREGARGRTGAEMARVLHLGGTPAGAGYRDLARALTPREVREGYGKDAKRVPAYTLRIANAVWGQRDLRFEVSFLSTLDTVYAAPLEAIDFRDSAAARKRINDWVADKTRDKIKDIVPEGMPDPLTRLALANAIYLKAPWADAFSERNTKADTFRMLDGSKPQAPFMRRLGRYPYAEVDGVQVLELPYRSNQLSMVVMLPRSTDGLKSLEERLVAGKLPGWERNLKSRRVDVRLPKFEFTTSTNLTEILPKMGMASAFDAKQADFSGMTSEEPLCIGAVLHKAFVGVDEKGTEAAAATVVMMLKGEAAPMPEEPVTFTADHPFVFVIRHRTTGAILFTGRLTKP